MPVETMAIDPRPERPLAPLSERAAKSRRARNIAIGLGIGLLVVLFYAVTIVKLAPGILPSGS